MSKYIAISWALAFVIALLGLFGVYGLGSTLDGIMFGIFVFLFFGPVVVTSILRLRA